MFLFIVMLITKFHNSKINACCHSSWRVDAWIQNWLVSSFLTRMGDLVNTVCGLSGKKYFWKNKIFKMIWEYYTDNDNNKISMFSHISVISYTKWYAYRSLCTNNHTVPLFHKSFFLWLFVMTRTPSSMPEWVQRQMVKMQRLQ